MTDTDNNKEKSIKLQVANSYGNYQVNQDILSKMVENNQIILTGGYANFFKKIIKKKATVDQNITIKGISKVYKELI